MGILKSIYHNFEEYVCTIFVSCMIICLGLQVAMRIISGASIAWSEELSRYCFLWTVYIGAALVAKRNAHVRITAQFSFLPIGGRLFFRILADCIWIAFNLYLAANCIITIQNGLQFPEISPTLGVVKSWVEMVIPFGFVLMSWRIVEQYYILWTKGSLASLVNYEEGM